MNAILFLFGIVFAVQFNVQSVLADVNGMLVLIESSLDYNFLYNVKLKNNDDSKTVCSVEFSLTPKNETWFAGNARFDAIGDAPNHYKVSADIAPGATIENSGTVFVYGGGGEPTFRMIKAKYYKHGVCEESSSSSGGGGKSSSTKSSCSACSSSTNNDGLFKRIWNKLSNKKNGSPLHRMLNNPVKISSFERNGRTANSFGGPWECGRNSSSILSAAVYSQLFNAEEQSKEDGCAPICNDFCVKIDYQGKSLTVPISHKCPTCELNQIALTKEAFNILEPNGNVTIARGATLTYYKCPSHIKAC